MSGLDEKGLRPCPFCGGRGVLVVTENSMPRTYVVECEGPCMCEGPPDWDEAKAISDWNRRVPATPADVSELVEQYRKLERELSSTKNTDLRADIKDDIIGLSAELATALEQVTRERDEARATLDEVCLSNRQEWQRATSAEAKLAEALADRAAQAERMARLEAAARDVVRFDWSDNDDDAVAAIERLRAILRAKEQETRG